MLIRCLQGCSLVLVFFLAACTDLTLLPAEKDAAPLRSIDVASIHDAVPRNDPITRAGNKNPYTVLGKTYHLLPTSKGYYQGGVASWYGTKFHGQPTANGETYSLYGMTAAHKTLPIPSYVKVTNIDNQRTVIVRVNDRGPFHDYRIIDLSYAAAVKLGYAKKGTAKVIVEVIDPDTYQTTKPMVTPVSSVTTTLTTSKVQYFLQVAAFKQIVSANQLRTRLLLDINHPVKVIASEPAGFYRVQLGSFDNMEQVQQVSEHLQKLNYGSPRLITKTLSQPESH